MSNDGSIYLRLMKEAIAGVDPASLPRVRVNTDWLEIQILTDPFVIWSKLGYAPVVLVETPNEEGKHILYISAKSLSDSLEPIRRKRDSLVGLNIRVRKTGAERTSTYEAEELAD